MGKSCSFGLLCGLPWALVKFCVCPSLPFGTEGRIWVVIVLIPDHCLSIFFKNICTFYRVICLCHSVFVLCV